VAHTRLNVSVRRDNKCHILAEVRITKHDILCLSQLRIFYDTVDKLAAVFGEAILAPVRGLPNCMFKYYVFREYNSNTDIPIEVQVCQALEQQKFISVAYRSKECRVWTDICQILFCQAFLYKHEGVWLFDEREIRNPSAIETCWNNLKTHQIQDFFQRQWSFLEELFLPNAAVKRRELLLRTLLFNFGRTNNQDNQSTDNTVRGRELLLRVLLSYDAPIIRLGSGSSRMKRYYSHYHNELESLILELSSSENFSIKESFSEISPSDYHFIGRRQLSSALRNRNKRYFHGYTDDGRTFYFRYIFMHREVPFVKRVEASIKEGIDIDFHHLWRIYPFTEPLTYYLDLLQCIDESSLSTLMEDLLSDFTGPRQYYWGNEKNVDLNPWQWGMPDIVAYEKENKFHVLLECKGPKNRLIKTQIKWLSRNLEKYKLNVGLVVVNENQVGRL